MSARTKKRLTVYSIIAVLLICGFSLYILMKESTSQENVEEGGNVETLSSTPTLMSKTKTENETARSGSTREYIVEKIYEYIDEQTQETVRDTVKTKIIEVGSGLNYFDATENKWKPSNPHFVDMGGYYELVESAYKVTIPKKLGNEITYNVDGTPLRLQFKHIVVSDGENSTTLNVPANITGTIDANNTSIIKFSNVWTGIDVEYHAGKGRFQQDIIIKDRSVLNANDVAEENMKVYFYTAMDTADYANDNIDIKIFGETVDTAAGIFRNTPPDKDNEIQFVKGGDSAPLHCFGISPLIDSEGNEIEKAERQLYKDVSAGTLYYAESIDLARIQNGAILDYNIVSGTISQDTVWTADATYYVSSSINLGAKLVIEPGTVIKFNGSTSLNINSGGEIIAIGEPYRYIMFTSKTDDQSGEDLTETSTSGTSGYYGSAINLTANASQDSRINYCKIAYATYGIYAAKTLSESARLSNNIIYNSSYGLYLYSAGNTAQNNLIWSCNTGIYMVLYSLTAQALNIYNNTIDNSSGNGMYIGLVKSGSITIKDNILSNCTYGIFWTGGGTIINDYNAYYGNTNDTTFNLSKGANSLDDTYNFTQPIYDTSVLGDYYINDEEDGGDLLQKAGSRYASTAGLDGEEFTWKAPTVPLTSITSDPAWAKDAINGYEQNDKVTIGYHHNRVDYVLTDTVTASNGSSFDFTINPGVVVAISGDSHSLEIGYNCVMSCVGNSDDEIIFSNSKLLSMSIETPTGNYNTQTGILINNDPKSPNQKIKHVVFQGFYKGTSSLYNINQYFEDNTYRKNLTGLYVTHLGTNHYYQNCLFYYNDKGIWFDADSMDVSLREFYNMTLYKNTIGIQLKQNYSGRIVDVYDCLFVENSKGIKSIDYLPSFDESNCAYWGNEVNIEDSNGDSVVMSLESINLTESPFDASWETNLSWDDRWYLVQDGESFTPCIDAGSRTALSAGLEFFTTKNTSDFWFDAGQVDIGYHYDPGYADTTEVSEVTITNTLCSIVVDYRLSVAVDFGSSYNWKIEIFDLENNLIRDETGTGDISWIWDGLKDDGETQADDGTYRVKISSDEVAPDFTPFYFYIYFDTSANGGTITDPVENGKPIGY